MTLSTPQGCTISGTAEIDSPPSAKYPANGPPCPEMPALVAHPVTAKRMDWATRIGQGVTSVTNAGGTGSAETFQRQIAATPGYTLPYWQQRLLTKWDPWAFLDAQQPLAQAGDCITVSTLACAGQNMIGVAASPHQAYATADNPATPSSCQHCVRSTTTYTDNNGVQHSYFIKLNYWGNNFEGFFTVNDGGTIKAYTVYDPRGPFVNQVYYYLDVLRDATRLGTYRARNIGYGTAISCVTTTFGFTMGSPSGPFRQSMARPTQPGQRYPCQKCQGLRASRDPAVAAP